MESNELKKESMHLKEDNESLREQNKMLWEFKRKYESVINTPPYKSGTEFRGKMKISSGIDQMINIQGNKSFENEKNNTGDEGIIRKNSKSDNINKNYNQINYLNVKYKINNENKEAIELDEDKNNNQTNEDNNKGRNDCAPKNIYPRQKK